MPTITLEEHGPPIVRVLGGTLHRAARQPKLARRMDKMRGSVALKSTVDPQAATITFDRGEISIVHGAKPDADMVISADLNTMGRPGSPKPKVTGAMRHLGFAMGYRRCSNRRCSGLEGVRSTSSGVGGRQAGRPISCASFAPTTPASGRLGAPGGSLIEMHGPAWVLEAVFTGGDHLGAAMIEQRLADGRPFPVSSPFIGRPPSHARRAMSVDYLRADTTMVRVEGTIPDGPMVGKHLSPPSSRAAARGHLPGRLRSRQGLAGTPQLGWWSAWRQPNLGDMYLRRPHHRGGGARRAGVISFLGNFTQVDGRLIPVCPRTLLQRQQGGCNDGLRPKCAFELEFFVYEEPLDVAREKGFVDLTPLGSAAHKRSTSRSGRLNICRCCSRRRAGSRHGHSVGGVQRRGGARAVRVEPGARRPHHHRRSHHARQASVAGRRLRTRTVSDVHGPTVARVRQRAASPLSLWRDGVPAFAGGSDALRHWVGGCVATVAGATSIYTPTINSFRARSTSPRCRRRRRGRGEQGGSVPHDHRTARSPASSTGAASADANPYLVLAAALAGGIAGWRVASNLRSRRPSAVGLRRTAPAARVDHRRGRRAGGRREPAQGPGRRLRRQLGRDAEVGVVMFHSEGGDPDAPTVTPWEMQRYFEWV